VLGMTIDYEKQFKLLADQLAREHITERALEQRVLRHLWVINDDTGKRARAHRERAIEHVLALFHGTAAPATRPETARGASGWRLTRSASTSTTDVATPRGRTKCNGHSRTPRSSSGRSS
jgi:hypothetical protein